MKRILTLLLVFIMVIQISVFNVAADEEEVTYRGMQYSLGTPAQKSSTGDDILIYPANPVGWKVSVPYETGAIKLIYRTNKGNSGLLQIRLGSSTGEIIGTLETDLIATDWADYTSVIGFSRPIEGDQEIWITVANGTVGQGGGHWITQFTFLPYDSSNSFAEFREANAYKDINDDPNRHEINMLADLGVFSKDVASFMPDKPMSRLEFVSALGKLINAQQYQTAVSPFKDVKAGTEEGQLLTGLYQMGIINGDTDGNFRKTSFITYQEAATVCINALGYKSLSNNMNAVLDLAYSLDLFDGISFTDNKVTKSQAAKLIYNLLLADYLTVSEMTSTETFYNPTKNYLEKTTGYKHAKGVLTANLYTKLYAPKKSDRISIDGVGYKVLTPVNVDYLGAYCEFFYHEVDGERILDVIRPMPKVEWNYIESTTNIKFDVISERKLEYTVLSEDQEYEFELDEKTAIIYNGIALTKRLKTLIPDPEDFEGAVTTIDNNADGLLEAIWIDHVSRVIKVDVVSNGRIKDALTETVYDTTSKNFVAFINGRTAVVDEFKTGSILTIFESDNEGRDQYVRCVCEENIVKGTITSYSNGKYTIGDTEYNAPLYLHEDLYVGFTGTFFLDKYNVIVACEEDESSPALLGLYLANDKGKETALDSVAQIKLLTEEGIKKYPIAQKIIADGVVIKNVDDFYEGNNGAFTGMLNVPVQSPVLYRINSSGQISMLDTINDGTKDKDDQLTNLIEGTDDNPLNSVTTGSYRIYTSSIVRNADYMGHFGYDNATVKVIGVTSNADESVYQIITGNSPSSDDPVELAPYSISRDSLVADILLIKEHTQISNVSQTPLVVDYVTEGIDEKGEVVKVINGFTNVAKAKYIVDADKYSTDPTFKLLIDSLQEGYMVNVYLTQNKVTKMDVIYIPQTEENEKFGPAEWTSGQATLLSKDRRNLYGTAGYFYLFEIDKIEKHYIKIKLQSKNNGIWTDNYYVFNAKTASVILCEKTPKGTYTFTYGMPVSSMLKDFHK